MSDTILQQWVNGNNFAAQGAAKRHEIANIYGPGLQRILDERNAKAVVDFQADEAVNAAAFCAADPSRFAIFVLPPPEADPKGEFRKMAEAAHAPVAGQLSLVASSQDIADASVDIILLTNILSCQGKIEDAAAAVRESARMLKPGGAAIVTTNNPRGGKFSTYDCTDVPTPRSGGGFYKLQLAGQAEPFDDLYIPSGRLVTLFAHAGLGFREALPGHEDVPDVQLVADADFVDDAGVTHPAAPTQPAFFRYTFVKPDL